MADRLPKREEQLWPLPEATPTSARQEIPRRIGVLLADDERDIRDVLGIWLRGQGFAVWLAGCGWEALTLYRQHCREINAVVLDVRMPGLDGPRTLAALRELNPLVRCCFLTGDLGRYTESQLLEAGAAAVLTKPANLDEFTQVVRHLASPDVNTVAPATARECYPARPA